MTGLRTLIIDDHPIVLAGLRLLLADDARFDLVGEAMAAPAARDATDRLQPDIIVTDLAMGGADGIALIEDLVAIAPAAAVLVYSSYDEQAWAPQVLRAGGRGFVSKAGPLDAVAAALATIVAGGTSVSAAVERLLDSDFATPRARGRDLALSARELQVLRLMGGGHSLQTIGLALGLSVKTVGTYRERLKIKLGLDSVRSLERVAHDHVANATMP